MLRLQMINSYIDIYNSFIELYRDYGSIYVQAMDRRETQPGDTLEYMQKWVSFQELINEYLPMIPIYSNVYFDFFPRYLQNYNISENVTWSQAIVSAFLSDASDEDIEEAMVRAEAIVQIRNTGNLRDFAELGRNNDEVGTISSIDDLRTRLEYEVGGEVSEINWGALEKYIAFAPDKFFEITITGASLGITHTIKAVAIIEDSKVRYIRWQEDP